MKTKGAILLCALLAVFFAFTACDGGTDGGGRTVKMWTFAPNNAAEWEARRASIEKQFNIKLVIEQVAQNGFVEKLQSNMNAGTDVPDVIEWLIENNRVLDANPAKSYVLPLDDYTKNSAVFSKVVPGRVAWVTYGGHVYGLPHDVHPVILIYNDTIWKQKAGTDIATIKTWDEFFAAAKKLVASETVGGKPAHYALPYGNNGLQQTCFMIWQQTGSQILDASGKPTITDPKFVDYMKKWQTWVDSGVFTDWDWGKFGALVANGTICSFTSPDWWVSQVDAGAKEGKYQFRVRALPEYAPGSPKTASWGGTFLAIPRGNNNPSFIYKVMEYMQYEKAAITVRYKDTGMLAPMSEIWDDQVFKQPDARFGGQKLGELQTAMARELPKVVSGNIFWDAINDITEQYTLVMAKKQTIEEALKKAQEAAAARLK
jgi:arabinosaccharide transport system substrate-binding protein